jgi:hypothetical protein
MLAMRDKFAPIRRSDGYALTEERLNWHLENWRIWVSSSWDAELAYTVSHGTSYSVDFDDLCAEMDRRAAMTTKACIDDLSPCESCAIFNKLCAAVFRLRAQCKEIDGAWYRARWKLAQELYKRGLV